VARTRATLDRAEAFAAALRRERLPAVDGIITQDHEFLALPTFANVCLFPAHAAGGVIFRSIHPDWRCPPG
jgi:hypothetical protein